MTTTDSGVGRTLRGSGDDAGAPGEDVRFVADVMLGKLARWLRALGYDTLYLRDAPDARLLGVALRQARRLLTRDVGLARRARHAGLLIRSDEVDVQIAEVMTACRLVARHPMSRCLLCNASLARRRPEEVRDRVPPYTFATQPEFWSCSDCNRVFWRGTHAAGILKRLRPYLGAAGSRSLEASAAPDATRTRS